MNENNIDKDNIKVFKFLFVGNSGVGKTTLLRRLVNEEHKQSNHSPTIGINLYHRYIDYLGNWYKIHLWDTAGQKRFDPIVRTMFDKVDLVVFVCDITNTNSIIELQKWIKCLDRKNKLPIWLLCNKFDIYDTENIDYVSKTLNSISKLIEVNDDVIIKKINISAKTGYNIEETFDLIFDTLYQHQFHHKLITEQIKFDNELKIKNRNACWYFNSGK